VRPSLSVHRGSVERPFLVGAPHPVRRQPFKSLSDVAPALRGFQQANTTTRYYVVILAEQSKSASARVPSGQACAGKWGGAAPWLRQRLPPAIYLPWPSVLYASVAPFLPCLTSRRRSAAVSEPSGHDPYSAVQLGYGRMSTAVRELHPTG